MQIRTIRTEGLGDSTHILGHDGIGLVVDPQRDIDRFLGPVEEMGIEVRWVFETHVHNDYVSGARELARALDAELVLPAGAAPVYCHLPAFHGEDLTAGALSVRPVHTPGHTPEHLSYLVLLEGREQAVFSGGSLLVGSAGRSDLLGQERSYTLARLQFGSLRRLAALPDHTGLYPTHGAGSFCTASRSSGDTSSIGVERTANPALQTGDEDAFVSSHLGGATPFPAYYADMAPINLRGAPPIDLDTAVPRIDEGAFRALPEDSVVVDARPRDLFAAGHLPGSLGVELRDDFSVWVGWLTPHDARVVLVLGPGQSLEEARRQLGRIGYDRIEGVIEDLDRWTRTRLVSYPIHDVGGFADHVAAGAQVLDSRAPDEWESGQIAGAVKRYAPHLLEGIPEGLDPDRSVFVACETGYRATISASILERNGYRPEVLVGAGVGDVLQAMAATGEDG